MDSVDGQRNAAATAFFWICLALGLGALLFGFAPSVATLDALTRERVADWHVSLGLTAAIALLAALVAALLRIVGGKRRERSGWRGAATATIRLLVLLSLAAAIVTGGLGAVFKGQPVYFWGLPLPLWEANDPATAETLLRAHRIAAFVLAGSILATLAASLAALVFPPVSAAARTAKLLETRGPEAFAKVISDGLSQNFRFFGWGALGLQFFLGFLSAPLIAFGFVGHSVSPDHSGFGDAITWASFALLLVFVSVVFDFFYTRIGRKIAAAADRYLEPERGSSFWFLGLGSLVSIAGVALSFVGVALSVALLIGKTVSQPPGIAITDPNKIIRALDVFVLMANFNLLFAHFIGFAITAWLSVSALKARHQTVLLGEKAKAD